MAASARRVPLPHIGFKTTSPFSSFNDFATAHASTCFIPGCGKPPDRPIRWTNNGTSNRMRPSKPNLGVCRVVFLRIGFTFSDMIHVWLLSKWCFQTSSHQGIARLANSQEDHQATSRWTIPEDLFHQRFPRNSTCSSRSALLRFTWATQPCCSCRHNASSLRNANETSSPKASPPLRRRKHTWHVRGERLPKVLRVKSTFSQHTLGSEGMSFFFPKTLRCKLIIQKLDTESPKSLQELWMKDAQGKILQQQIHEGVYLSKNARTVKKSRQNTRQCRKTTLPLSFAREAMP